MAEPTKLSTTNKRSEQNPKVEKAIQSQDQTQTEPADLGPRRSAFKVYGASKSTSPSPVATTTDLNNNQSTSGLTNKDGQIRKFPVNQAKLSDSRNSVFSTDSDNSALGSLLTRVKSMSDLENTEGVTYEMVRKRTRRRRGGNNGKNDGASVGSEGSGPSPRNLVSPRQFGTSSGGLHHHHSPNIPLSMKSSISAMSELSECLDEISETPTRKTAEGSNLNASVLSDMADHTGHNRSFSPTVFTGTALSPPTCRPIPIGRQSPLVSESKVKVVKVVHRA